MTEPFDRGAFARAALIAVCLLLVTAFAFAPHAQAAARFRSPWSALPGDAYRADLDPFAGLFRPPALRAGNGAPAAALMRGSVALLVEAKAEALGVPVRLALAIARFESGLRMSMRGAAGERGAMQVLPQTARQVGVTGNLYGEAGIEAGVRYLKLALALHRRDGWCAVASAYNFGVWRSPRCTRYGRAVVALAALR
ncbi:transglycosylase SLT domain-containing protein [uncultured Methylovirgula sp.]|uniref:transglycosylase SLT domain-containing protein n=1 Tax=uncultured Methylovirgula sp. TaxID=1285960 RepID=UPI00261A530C|nr:transglycosylase SLT domain-containing protein [uncultured Methylovirgula sp.]